MLNSLSNADVFLAVAGPKERIFKFQGGGGANCECVSVSQLRGSGGKLNSSEMARNGSKTAKSEVNF